MKKIFTFVLLASTATASASDDDFPGWSPLSHVDYSCKAGSASLGLRQVHRYLGCSERPSSVLHHETFTATLGSKELKLAIVDYFTASGIGEAKRSRREIEQELRKTADLQSGCAHALLAAGKPVNAKLPPADPDDPSDPDRIGRQTWRIAFTQRLELLTVCAAGVKNEKPSQVDTYDCSGEYHRSTAEYWDNGCLE